VQALSAFPDVVWRQPGWEQTTVQH